MRSINDPQFCEFLLRIGNGSEPYGCDDLIKIPEHMIIPYKNNPSSLEDFVNSVYPNLQTNFSNETYITGRAILTPKNDFVDEINNFILKHFPGESYTYHSFDSAIDDSNQTYPIEFLNKLTPNGMPPSLLHLKLNCPIILLRNIDPSSGLCNGTRLMCKSFKPNLIEAKIVTGHCSGNTVFIPRIPLQSTKSDKYPIHFQRKQFPVRLCFSMTINKAQGQTLSNVGIYLPAPVFSHGQLYVALSRAQSSTNVKLLIKHLQEELQMSFHTKNIVYHDLLKRANQ